jgi:hypothetical protein
LVFFMITFIFNFLSLITNYKSKGTKEHDDAINF